MKITYKDYIIEPSADGGYHLMKHVIRNKTKIKDGKKTILDETYEDLEIIGYNMQIHNCVKKIIHLNHCSKEETIELADYVKMFKREFEEIKNAINI